MKNRSAIKKIVAALDLRPGDTVIEIGAGHGELTEEIISNFQFLISNEKLKIVAVEKDGGLAEQLRKKFTGVEVIEGDALKVLPQLCSKFHASCFKICGNIPYYITGKLLRILSGLENKPELCVLTLQKEVAERIAAAPPKTNPVRGREGSQRTSASNGMNRLAASVQFWAEPEIIARISRKDFEPPPEVDSAIIKLETRNMKHETRWAEKYYKTVKILFQQPRKTILNNLIAGEKLLPIKKEDLSEKLRKIGINPNDRPQNLSVENIIKISKLFNSASGP